jgi:hypothetical protein
MKIIVLIFLILFAGCPVLSQVALPAFQAVHHSPAPNLNVGDTHQGGIVAYIFETGDAGYDAAVQHGLIAAITDQSTGIRWSNGSNITTGATGTAIGTGLANTNAIITAQGGTAGSYAYAAGICADYSVTEAGGTYDDWYLPSKDELNKLRDLHLIGFGGFDDWGYYWSSTEFNDVRAWDHFFYKYGSQRNDPNKSNSDYVRAVRSF